MTVPVVREHDSVLVVRDDLFPGGTKARFLGLSFEGVGEAVYASPAEGGRADGARHGRARLAKEGDDLRRSPRQASCAHARSRAARSARGADRPGHLSVVQARAREWSKRVGARLIPFGVDLPEAVAAIADAASATGLDPDEVWCAAGSGVLARGLALAWPQARRHVVQVGRALSQSEVAGAVIHVHPLRFGEEAKSRPPFPSDPHYDAKAWDTMTARRGAGRVVFWNVIGPARP